MSQANVGGVRAVLFATPRAASGLPVPADFPAGLLPLGHATLIERLLEQLVRAGVAEFDIVACDRPEALRRELGDGERWGVRLNWHLAKDPARPYAMLRSGSLPQAGRVVIGHADRWIAPETIRRLAREDHLLMHLHGGEVPAWTGWAGVPGAALSDAGADWDRSTLGNLLTRRGVRALLPEGAGEMPALDGAGLLAAQRAVVAGTDEAPLPVEWIPMPWGAVSAQARVHPEATVTGPVLIGPGCLVGAGARIGPNAVLCRDVVVAGRTGVRDAIVLPGTYLGQGLEVQDAIVNGGRVRHVGLGVETVLPRSEGLVMSLDTQRVLHPWPAGRLAAALAAAIVAPALAVAMIARRRGEPALPWGMQQVVVGLDTTTRSVSLAPLRCPRPARSALRRGLGRCGGLLDIVQGRRCWFGVRPRRSGEWYALPPEWQSLLASAPIGLLNAPAWAADEGTRLEAGAAADAFYTVRRNWRENFRIAVASLRPVGAR